MLKIKNVLAASLALAALSLLFAVASKGTILESIGIWMAAVGLISFKLNLLRKGAF